MNLKAIRSFIIRKSVPLTAAALTAVLLAPVAYSFRPELLRAEMLPVSEMRSEAADAAVKGEENFGKTAAAETIAMVKEAADSSGLSFLKLRYLSESSPESDTIKIDCNFAASSLLQLCDFIDTITLEMNTLNTEIVSLSVVSEKKAAAQFRRGLTAAEKKVYAISLTIARHREHAQALNSAGMLLSDYSAIIKYCSYKYEISSIILSEHSCQLALSGNFSLKGTKKSLLEFMGRKQFNRVCGFELSEKGYATAPNQILMPFLLKIYFEK